jgi:cytoskeletal protein CcmA (bactofilin family)
MLGSSKNKEKNNSLPGQAVINLIGAGTQVQGNIQCNGDIRIDGEVLGDVKVGQKLVVGATGSIKGKIEAAEVAISGTVHGNIHTENTTILMNKSSVTGDILTSQIVIEQGALFNGKCEMKRS